MLLAAGDAQREEAMQGKKKAEGGKRRKQEKNNGKKKRLCTLRDTEAASNGVEREPDKGGG